MRNDRTLVLNASYAPISVVSTRRAVILVLAGRADLVEEAMDRKIRSVSEELGAPVVIRLRRMVKVPYRRSVPLTRRALFSRDGHACAYCGHVTGLTIDHVLPRSRGGRHDWANVVASCVRCNHHKADRTPEEAGMTLRVQPYVPTGAKALMVVVGHVDEAWNKYLIG